jgi:hypothetical protein
LIRTSIYRGTAQKVVKVSSPNLPLEEVGAKVFMSPDIVEKAIGTWATKYA